MSDKKPAALKDLYDIVLQLKTIEDCEAFFDDLLSFKEEENIAQRIEAVKLLKQGKTYAEIVEITGISNTTLSRISKALQNGEGYKKFIK